MSEIEPAIVLAKLNAMSEYLESLQRFETISLEEYLGDRDRQLIVERLLQLVIQAGIDINRYLLKRLEIEQPETNFEAFIAVSRQGIIATELAERLSHSVGLRNRLVHFYEDIDAIKVHAAITIALGQYPLYQRQVAEYLNSLEVENEE